MYGTRGVKQSLLRELANAQAVVNLAGPSCRRDKSKASPSTSREAFCCAENSRMRMCPGTEWYRRCACAWMVCSGADKGQKAAT